MPTRRSILANENGAVIVVVIIILALLTLIGISASTTSTTEMNIASNDELSKMVFYTAEAGTEVGRQMLGALKAANPGAWDRLLSGTAFAWPDSNGNPVMVSTLDQMVEATASRTVGLGTFTLQVRDNDDLDGNPLVDTDDSLTLTSIGSYRNAQARIQVTVRYTGPGREYAQEHYGSSRTGTNANERAAVANTQRW